MLFSVKLISSDKKKAFLDADCITISPYLGNDSIEPFVSVCKQYGKGIFILVKTSNPGSQDLQEAKLVNGNELYQSVATMIQPSVTQLEGKLGYSSIGAVVGATYPAQAKKRFVNYCQNQFFLFLVMVRKEELRLV